MRSRSSHLGNFAGGVAGDGQLQFVGGDARAVVLDADAGLPAVFQQDVDLPGLGVEAVFHQFFHYAGGAFHHLAGGNLVTQCGR